MVYNDGLEIWCECDNDGFTQFAGINTSKHDVVNSMGRWGWTFREKVLCPFCSETAGLITHDANMFNHK